MNEQAASADFLLERMVNCEHRLRIDAFIINVGRDSHDAARLGADSDKLHDAVRPHQMTIDRILFRKKAIGDISADDDDALCAIAVRFREVTTRNEGDSKRGKETRGHRPKPGARSILPIFTRPASDRECPTVSKVTCIPPGNRPTHRHLFEARNQYQPALQLTIEVTHLFRCSAEGNDGNVDSVDVVPLRDQITAFDE
jgi:hypothetical protein